MSKIRTIGVSIVAAVAVSAVAAASASAALPELGKCENVGTGGAYRYAKCVIPSATHKGPYEFKAGPGALPKFEAEIGTPKLETTGRRKVSCTAGFIQGEWTGIKTATITLIELSGCGTEKTKCATSISGSSIKNQNPLEGELGLIRGGEKPIVGLDIKAKTPSTEVLSFICGQPILEPPVETWVIEGSVIGSVKPPNSMRTEYKLLYAAAAGKQAYESFEGGSTDVLSAKIVTESGPVTETVGLTLKGSEKAFILLIGEEDLEIKAK
jgi:hypothetical protein